MDSERLSSIERLVAKIRDAGIEIADDWAFHRTYAGRAQRQAEAWSWWIDWTDPNDRRWEIGSCSPIRELLRSTLTISRNRHELNSFVIDPA